MAQTSSEKILKYFSWGLSIAVHAVFFSVLGIIVCDPEYHIPVEQEKTYMVWHEELPELPIRPVQEKKTITTTTTPSIESSDKTVKPYFPVEEIELEVPFRPEKYVSIISKFDDEKQIFYPWSDSLYSSDIDSLSLKDFLSLKSIASIGIQKQKVDSLVPEHLINTKNIIIPLEERSPKDRTSTRERLDDHIRDVRREIMKEKEIGGNLLAIPAFIGKVLMNMHNKDESLPSPIEPDPLALSQIVIWENPLRMLILIWADGSFSPEKMSKRERAFLNMSSLQAEALLKHMNNTKLVVCIGETGMQIYRTNLTRRRVINAIAVRLTISNSELEKEALFRNLDLIKKYYDYEKKKVVILGRDIE